MKCEEKQRSGNNIDADNFYASFTSTGKKEVGRFSTDNT